MTPPRDDDQVEYKPGRTIRRDVGIRMGLISPEVRIGGARPAASVPVTDAQSEPVVPPPLQPSHEDLVVIAPEPAVAPTFDREGAEALLDGLTTIFHAGEPGIASRPAAPARHAKRRPAKRSLDAILAEADRGHRALRAKVRP